MIEKVIKLKGLTEARDFFCLKNLQVGNGKDSKEVKMKKCL